MRPAICPKPVFDTHPIGNYHPRKSRGNVPWKLRLGPQWMGLAEFPFTTYGFWQGQTGRQGA